MKKILLGLVAMVGVVATGWGGEVWADPPEVNVTCKAIDGGRTLAVSMLLSNVKRSWEFYGSGLTCTKLGEEIGVALGGGTTSMTTAEAQKAREGLDSKRERDGGGGSETVWKPSDNNGNTTTTTTTTTAAGSGDDCASILPDEWCSENNEGDGIVQVLGLVLNILTAGVGILATVGLVVSGIQYVLARDDAGRVAKVKSRIFNIVIGLLVYGVMWIVLQWLIPGGVLNGSGGGTTTTQNRGFEDYASGGSADPGSGGRRR